MELTLLWAAVTAFVAAWAGLRIFGEKVPESAIDRLVTAALIGLVAGRLIAMLGDGVNPITHLGDFIIVRGGVDTAAAAIAFTIVLVLTTRQSPGAVDALAPTVVIGLAGWHSGCVWRQACLGTPSDLPWAWAQPGSAVTRHPVEIYAALGLVVAAFLISKIGWRPWSRAGAAIAAAGGARLLTEPLRPSLTGGPVLWYIGAVLIGVVVAIAGSRLETARST